MRNYLQRSLAGSRSYLAEHVIDHDLQAASDREVWDFSLSCGAVIVTKDEDFAQRRAMVQVGPPIVWIRLPNSRREHLLDWFERALPAIVTALERGEAIVEVS